MASFHSIFEHQVGVFPLDPDASVSSMDDGEQESSVSSGTEPDNTAAITQRWTELLSQCIVGYEMDPSIELPTKWSEGLSCSELLSLSADGASAACREPEMRRAGMDDPAAAQANNAVPPTFPLYYFEVTIVDGLIDNKEGRGDDDPDSAGQSRLFRIGFGEEYSSYAVLPGDSFDSIGYSNGVLYFDTGKGRKILREERRFRKGDIVGCGLLLNKQRLFFTYNGELDVEDVECPPLPLFEFPAFPKVGLTQGVEVMANFGQESFKFKDLAAELIKALPDVKPSTSSLRSLEPPQPTVPPQLPLGESQCREEQLKKLYPGVPSDKLPDWWDRDDCRRTIHVGEDGLTLRFEGPDDSPAAIRTITHVDKQTCGMVYYFEVELTSLAHDGGGHIGVGYGLESSHLGRMVGSTTHSFGITSHDAMVHDSCTSFPPTDFPTPPFVEGDVVGAWLDFINFEIIFTLNGKYLVHGVELNKKQKSKKLFTREEMEKPFYPMVSIASPGVVVTANFGQKPFRYDIARTIAVVTGPTLSKWKKRDYYTQCGMQPPEGYAGPPPKLRLLPAGTAGTRRGVGGKAGVRREGNYRATRSHSVQPPPPPLLVHFSTAATPRASKRRKTKNHAAVTDRFQITGCKPGKMPGVASGGRSHSRVTETIAGSNTPPAPPVTEHLPGSSGTITFEQLGLVLGEIVPAISRGCITNAVRMIEERLPKAFVDNNRRLLVRLRLQWFVEEVKKFHENASEGSGGGDRSRSPEILIINHGAKCELAEPSSATGPSALGVGLFPAVVSIRKMASAAVLNDGGETLGLVTKVISECFDPCSPFIREMCEGGNRQNLALELTDASRGLLR